MIQDSDVCPILWLPIHPKLTVRLFGIRLITRINGKCLSKWGQLSVTQSTIACSEESSLFPLLTTPHISYETPWNFLFESFEIPLKLQKRSWDARNPLKRSEISCNSPCNSILPKMPLELLKGPWITWNPLNVELYENLWNAHETSLRIPRNAIETPWNASEVAINPLELFEIPLASSDILWIVSETPWNPWDPLKRRCNLTLLFPINAFGRRFHSYGHYYVDYSKFHPEKYQFKADG